MTSQIASRGTTLDLEQCVENIGNRYSMIAIAAARAREIRIKNKHSNRREFVFTELTSLLEIQNGTIGPTYLIDKIAERDKQLAATGK